MALKINFSPDVQAHIDAGHFNIKNKPWPSGAIWLIEKPDGTILTAKPTRVQAEEAAVAWYNEQAAQTNR